MTWKGGVAVALAVCLVLFAAAGVVASEEPGADSSAAGAHAGEAVDHGVGHAAADGETHAVEAADHGEGHGDGHAPHIPPMWLVAFFVAMLLAIAIFPLTPAHHWWESNRNRLIVTAVISAYPAYYYIVNDIHSLEHTMLTEYVPFIVLLGSLFMIAGGIRLTGDLRATPEVNATFLGIGALLASFVGTTGAAMLLIRPVCQTNRERRYRVHTIIFFIFLVANIGGCLLPIGDPPLFLGYLAGIPFFWTMSLWKVWLPTVIVVLAIYYFLDKYFVAKESPEDIARDVAEIAPLRIQGSINFLWLAGVVLAVIFMNPGSPIAFFRTPYLREITQGVMILLSFITTRKGLRKENEFTMGPIFEVAILFVGIFTTVIPALALLKIHGPSLGVDSSMKFFWATGTLSSFLDNAPTYFVFFKTAASMAASGDYPTLVGTLKDNLVPEHFLTSISLGAVFMGAMTYIGNGPNFMVKAIAEEAGIRMPSFFGYMKWSVAVLLPVFLVVSFVFFRG